MPSGTSDELEWEIRGSAEQRRGHRMHAVWFHDRGMSYEELARWFKESERTIMRWVSVYKAHGKAALREKPRPGRPRRLTAAQRDEVLTTVKVPPQFVGRYGDEWTAPMLCDWIKRRFGTTLSERQCRRLIHEGRSRGRR